MIRYSIHRNPSLQEIGYNGEGTIAFNVTGYRPDDGLKIEVKREHQWRSGYGGDAHYKWKVDIEFPRWSRDQEVEPCNITTTENIQHALVEAIPMMKNVMANTELLEKHFQIGEAERKAEKERQEAEAKAARDADKPVGMKLAKEIIGKMIREAREGNRYREHAITMFTRGKRSEQNLKVHYTGQLTLFNLGWSRISRKKALEYLADSAIDVLKVDGIQFVDPKVAKFLLGEKNG